MPFSLECQNGKTGGKRREKGLALPTLLGSFATVGGNSEPGGRAHVLSLFLGSKSSKIWDLWEGETQSDFSGWQIPCFFHDTGRAGSWLTCSSLYCVRCHSQTFQKDITVGDLPESTPLGLIFPSLKWITIESPNGVVP